MAKISKSILSMIAPIVIFLLFGKWRIEDVFDVFYKGNIQSRTIRKIFRDVYGDEYLEDVDATSYVTRTDLQNMARYLNIGPGDSLVDIACGRGGPGLWMARETGANLTGIDISKVAVIAAHLRISEFNLKQNVHFLIGSFEKTGLPDACCDAAMSVDALFLARDKAAAVREVRRILRPGGRFVFTTWEGDKPLMVRDHRRLLSENGFFIEVCEETAGWKGRQEGVYKRILEEKEALVREMGRDAARIWIREANNAKQLDRGRRVLVVGRKEG